MTNRSSVLGVSVAGQLARSLGLTEDLTIDPSTLSVCREFAFSSSSAEDFSAWYLRSQVFSKFRSDGASDDLRRAAFEGFLEADRVCGLSNSRLVDPWSRCSLDLERFRLARTICHRILGRFKWNELPRSCGFGPGASSGLSRRESSQQNKWALSTHITEEALPYRHAFQKWANGVTLNDSLVVVAGNKVTTVPKDYRKDRVIAIEPDWNMFFQKGVGAMLRRRLSRWGLLTPDAQEKNRAAAQRGSADGMLATLDMSAASDSISLGLCELLLPDDWMKVLYDLRSPVGSMKDGTRITYEKISSMGNGFTFELETLCFYALALSVVRKEDWEKVLVYGDDIVCPSRDATDLIGLLAEAGFSTNVEKSFSTGPFRESCGGHYWLGLDVSPFYLRHLPETVGDYVTLSNACVTWAALPVTDASLVRHTYQLAVRGVPKKFWGPYGTAGCLWREWDECKPTWNKAFQSYRQFAVARKHRYLDLHDRDGAYLHKLWVGNPDLESSWLGKATSRETSVRLYKDRESWSRLPVRLA